jgi:redox-sensitive bicupin YhaK (pirin superfamily)
MDKVSVHQLVRATDRPSTRIDWLDSRHSFSFGDNYDPANTHHGVLLVNNDDRVAPQQGFDTHPHRDMEIVTWVLSGSLIHQDSMGHSGVIYPGLAQRMSAGTGIRHSERNDTWQLQQGTGTDPVHFVQMWVLPDEAGITPGYDQLDIGDQLRAGGLVTVASGMAKYDSAIRIANRSAAFHVARLAAGESVTLPDLPWGHVFVATGSVNIESTGAAQAGDAVRITDGGGEKLTAITDAEVLVWEMHKTLGQ